MNSANRHRMTWIQTSEDKTEEWHCETCGRVMLVKWNPFSVTYPEEGDRTAAHYGETGGISIASTQVSQAFEDLSNWEQGLKDLDLSGI